MKQNMVIPVRSLQLFAEGGEGAAAEGLPQSEAAPEDRGAEFDKLIQGRFQDIYDARISDAVKDSRETAARYNALTPALGLLAKKYGVDPADAEALGKAIEGDASLSPEKAEQARREAAHRQYALWARQAEQARQVYPSLDLRAEAQNPRFRQLLRAGVDVGSAYLVIHQGDILPAAMRHTARVVEQKLVGKLLAGSARPDENGISAQSAAVTRSDVSQMTKADREEIRRRVAAGERIRF